MATFATQRFKPPRRNNSAVNKKKTYLLLHTKLNVKQKNKKKHWTTNVVIRIQIQPTFTKQTNTHTQKTNNTTLWWEKTIAVWSLTCSAMWWRGASKFGSSVNLNGVTNRVRGTRCQRIWGASFKLVSVYEIDGHF